MDNSKFQVIKKLKEVLEKYPRTYGYYLIGIVSIQEKRQEKWDEETIIDWAFQQLDDQKWDLDNRPNDQSWLEDYQTTRQNALEVLTIALTGGSNVGHIKNTIEPKRATELTLTFDGIFRSPKKYFERMGFGNRSYTFQDGIGIADKETVGIFVVVESD